MKQKFVDKCMSIIRNNNKNLTSRDIDKFRYGLEGFYLNTTKIVFIVIVSLILGIFKETILLLFLFNIIRFTGFGVHARKSLHCLVSSTIFFIGFPLICIYAKIPLLIKYIIILPLILMFGILAPADTEKRPLIHKKRRIIYKVLSVIIAIVYLVLSILTKNNTLSNCFIFSLIIQIIVMLPITYKIFGVNYNNYKQYETNF